MSKTERKKTKEDLKKGEPTRKVAFTVEDVEFLRGVCEHPEFIRQCSVALRLAKQHALRERERGQSTNRAEAIARTKKAQSIMEAACRLVRSPQRLGFFAAYDVDENFADQSFRHDQLAVDRLYSAVSIAVDEANKLPKRLSKNALNIAAILIVKAFRSCGLEPDLSLHSRSAVKVLQLVCQRAGIYLGLSSYKIAIRNGVDAVKQVR